jgi:hypothetical protein
MASAVRATGLPCPGKRNGARNRQDRGSCQFLAPFRSPFPRRRFVGIDSRLCVQPFKAGQKLLRLLLRLHPRGRASSRLVRQARAPSSGARCRSSDGWESQPTARGLLIPLHLGWRCDGRTLPPVATWRTRRRRLGRARSAGARRCLPVPANLPAPVANWPGRFPPGGGQPHPCREVSASTFLLPRLPALRASKVVAHGQDSCPADQEPRNECLLFCCRPSCPFLAQTKAAN